MILGIVGSIASGKDISSEYLIQKGIAHVSLSDIVRQLMRAEGLEITTVNMMNYANALRKEKGGDYLAKLALEEIGNKNAVISSLRQVGEIEYLKKHGKLHLLKLDAPIEVRLKRLIKRNRPGDVLTMSDLKSLEAKQADGKEKGSMNMTKCYALADETIVNDSTLAEHYKKLDDLCQRIGLVGNTAQDDMHVRPSWDEYFIEIMDTVAHRATCDRGRSGCVITRDNQILATGYVGSAAGDEHCDEIGHLMQKRLNSDGSISEHCIRTVHAEQNALCQAAKYGIAVNGATLYCRMEPCPVCAKLIVNSGIKRVVAQRRYHAAEESRRVFEKCGVQLDVVLDEVQKYVKA